MQSFGCNILRQGPALAGRESGDAKSFSSSVRFDRRLLGHISSEPYSTANKLSVPTGWAGKCQNGLTGA